MNRILTFALLFVTAALSASAHEPAGGRTELTIRDGRYTIEMTVEALITLNRLELAAGVPLSFDVRREGIDRELGRRASELCQAADVRIDGNRETPAVSLEPIAGGEPGRTLVTISGGIPSGAATMEWGWTLASAPYLLVVRQGTADPVIHSIDGSAPRVVIPLRRETGALERAGGYIGEGFLHIVPLGVDHVLFVLGLFFFSSRIRDVVLQASVFTIAHSLTLALAIFGVVRIPAAIVEPLIALSIVFVAVENLASPEEFRPRRVAVVFVFGLLHGLGFAGVLAEIGLTGLHRVVALLAFNVGVELGQLAVIGAAFVLIASWSRERRWYRAVVANPASIAIGAIGLWWTIERVALS